MNRLVAGCAMLLTGACCTAHTRLLLQDEAVISNDLRAVQDAQATYQAMNAGGYDTLECLAAPSRCMRGYPEGAPVFLPAHLATLAPENGYVRTFHAGQPLPATAPHASRSSLLGWAYTAVPERERSGRKSFCADSTGRICVFLDGAAPRVEDALCPSPCERIR